jgi:hypothetical protein
MLDSWQVPQLLGESAVLKLSGGSASVQLASGDGQDLPLLGESLNRDSKAHYNWHWETVNNIEQPFVETCGVGQGGAEGLLYFLLLSGQGVCTVCVSAALPIFTTESQPQ